MNRLKRLIKRLPLANSLLRQRQFRHVSRHIKGDNAIHCEGARLSEVVFDIEGENNRIHIGDGCSLNGCRFYIRGDDHVVFIAPHCVFGSGSEIWIEDRACHLTVGEGSTFESVHLALTEPHSKITIGRDCMFARDIDVRTGDSHSIVSQQTGARINPARDVCIGDHVWVAAHCVILKSVSLAENTVVATGSIVTRSFSTAGVIIGGNPAVQLKEGVNWLRERI